MCLEFKSEAPATEEMLDRVVCSREQFSFQMCLESGDGSKTFSNWRQSSRQLVPSGAYLSGGPLRQGPPPFEAEKNYEKSKINRKWREHGQFDIVYFK